MGGNRSGEPCTVKISPLMGSWTIHVTIALVPSLITTALVDVLS